MKIVTLIVGPFQVNCYLYWDPSTRQGVIIDPGDEDERIIAAVAKADFIPQAVLLTHGHVDHIAAVETVMRHFRIPLCVGAGEEHMVTDPTRNMSALIAEPLSTPYPDKILQDNELFRAGSVEFRVLATPGHSPGGVCYLDERAGVLFCGDTLFWGSVGRTDFPGCSHEQLIDSINRRILTLPGSVVCHPGHGPSTTVQGEKTNNPFLSGGYVV